MGVVGVGVVRLGPLAHVGRRDRSDPSCPSATTHSLEYERLCLDYRGERRWGKRGSSWTDFPRDFVIVRGMEVLSWVRNRC